VTATVCRDNAGVQALQNRMQAMRAAWRSSTSFDHRAEWQRIAGRPLSEISEQTLEHFQAEMLVDPPAAPSPHALD
jgi:hypothetical protein